MIPHGGRLRRGLLGLAGGALAGGVAIGLGRRVTGDGDHTTEAFGRGLESFRAGDYTAAAAAFSAAAEDAPPRVDAQVLRGMALVRLGRAAEAIEAYSRAVALDPGRATTYLYRAEALAALGDLARADADLERAMQLGRGDARVAVAVALQRKRRDEEAHPLPH